MCAELAATSNLTGWRQRDHLWKKVKSLSRKIDRIALKKGPNYVARMKVPYRELLRKAQQITERARQLCLNLFLPTATQNDLFGPHTLQAFIARTERVMDTARRRVLLLGETVPNSDKLFSVFEPHTQLYKRGKAGEPVQFGRQVLVFEDAAGFIVHRCLMPRDRCDSQVAVEETKIVQKRFDNRVQRLSFDRGFHSPGNQAQLSELVTHLCLPKPGARQSVKQLADADDDFLAAKQNHSGIESAIGALQSGNGLKRCRDCSEVGFERYLSLAILGRNLHTLGRLLIAEEAPRRGTQKRHPQARPHSHAAKRPEQRSQQPQNHNESSSVRKGRRPREKRTRRQYPKHPKSSREPVSGRPQHPLATTSLDSSPVPAPALNQPQLSEAFFRHSLARIWQWH